MARAARKKQVKRKQRRTDARGKRLERPGAKAARGSTARTRTAARKRVAKQFARKVDATKRALKRRVASVRRSLKVSATKRAVKRRIASVKRAVKVAIAKRVVKKRVASLKRSVAKSVASARTRLKTAKKRATAAGASMRKRATKTVKAAKSAIRRASAKALRPVPPAFAVQRATATAREELLFDLQRARATVKAAVQGLASGLAERPIAPGKWSIKEIVLHLSERDRVRLEEFSRTLGGQSRSWAGIETRAGADQNEAHLSPLRAHGWDDALRRLDSLREQLLLRLSEVPAHPDDVWQPGHPFADMMWGLPEHDRHHAIQIKLARIGVEDPVEE